MKFKNIFLVENTEKVYFNADSRRSNADLRRCVDRNICDHLRYICGYLRSRIIFQHSLVLLLTITLQNTAYCEEAVPKVKQEVYTFRVEGFDEKKKLEWGLEGESARVILDKVDIKNLRGIYYGGDTTFTIFADKAIYDKTTHDVELSLNIVGKTSDGSELTTDYAHWNAGLEEITTDSYVIVKRKNIVCKGRGLFTKPRLKWVTFREDVEVDIEPDKKITCSGPFEIDHTKHIAIFNNNVKIIEKNSETYTDKLTVYLNPDTNQVDHIVTEGNVKIVHTGKIEEIGELSF